MWLDGEETLRATWGAGRIGDSSSPDSGI